MGRHFALCIAMCMIMNLLPMFQMHFAKFLGPIFLNHGETLFPLNFHVNEPVLEMEGGGLMNTM